MPKFMTSKINLKSGNFNDFVQKIIGNKKTASSAKVVKTAEKEEATNGQPEIEAKLVNKPETEEKPKTKDNKAKNNEPCCTSGQPEAEAKLVNKPEVKEDPYKSANSCKWQKIAKLDGKTRAMLKDYWSTLYPADYVDAMLAEE